MPAVKRTFAAGAALVLASAPALGVGLGPLAKEGTTDGPRKAFYLTLINPYPDATGFRAYAVAADGEAPQARVRILPDDIRLAARGQRRILVVADGLVPGESYAFRVCAERAPAIEGVIHARVCSRLTARRLPAA